MGGDEPAGIRAAALTFATKLQCKDEGRA